MDVNNSSDFVIGDNMPSLVVTPSLSGAAAVTTTVTNADGDGI